MASNRMKATESIQELASVLAEANVPSVTCLRVLYLLGERWKQMDNIAIMQECNTIRDRTGIRSRIYNDQKGT